MFDMFYCIFNIDNVLLNVTCGKRECICCFGYHCSMTWLIAEVCKINVISATIVRTGFPAWK